MIRSRFAVSLSLLAALFAPAAGYAASAAVSGDTYISQTNPANNFGAIGTMNVSSANSALIQFDLAALQALGLTNANIQKAYLTVFVNRALVGGGLDFALTNQAWSETLATFNNFNQGLIGAPFASNVPVLQSGVFVKIDVTNQVRDWLTGVVTNNGIIVKAAVAQPGTSVVLDSKESTTTSEPAFLDIVLTGVGPTGATGPAGGQGPSGPQGATGPSGPSGSGTGPSGPSGAAGAQGPSGPSGAAGAQGASGPSGAAGAQGPSGPSGAAGAQGASGPSGAAGAQGPSGPSGAAGVAGAQGASGPSGSAGAQGVQGPQGIQGIQGPSGPAGTNGTNGGGNLSATFLAGGIGAATRYGPPYSGPSIALNAAEGVVATRFAIGCTVSSLEVRVIDGASAFPYTGVSQTAMKAGIRVNGADALVCTTSGGSTCNNAGSSVIANGSFVNVIIANMSNTTNAVVQISSRCQ